MPKYRLLSREELQELEKEFVEYLVVNGITAEDWVRMKEEEGQKAEEIISLFSDVVFEGIMRKVQYLEHREPLSIKAFQCLPHKMVLVGMDAPPESGADFTKGAYLSAALHNPPAGLEVYTTEKGYGKQREVELFEMTQAGAEIADGSTFKTLCLALGK